MRMTECKYPLIYTHSGHLTCKGTAILLLLLLFRISSSFKCSTGNKNIRVAQNWSNLKLSC